MNIRDLRYLVAFADYQHFSKAAEACCVSQPALSMQIKKLEDTLGVQLLERSKKTVFLTNVGESLVVVARDILRQVDELKAVAKSALDPYSGELKIGIIPTLAPYLLPNIMPSLSLAFPKLTMYLAEEQTASILEKLKARKLDIALLALPVNEEGLTEALLFEEEFMLALPKDHPLSDQTRIQLADLANQDVLLLDDGHCFREQALAVCKMAKAHEFKQFRATSIETLRHMVASGIGVTLMPKLACNDHDGLVYLPIHDPQPSRKIGLVWRNTTTKANVYQAISNHLRSILQKA